MKPEDKLLSTPETPAEELSLDELDAVTGAGNPFDKVPRVQIGRASCRERV